MVNFVVLASTLSFIVSVFPSFFFLFSLTIQVPSHGCGGGCSNWHWWPGEQVQNRETEEESEGGDSYVRQTKEVLQECGVCVSL